jgi:hypothetical protein
MTQTHHPAPSAIENGEENQDRYGQDDDVFGRAHKANKGLFVGVDVHFAMFVFSHDQSSDFCLDIP